MTRVKRGNVARKRRKKILKLAKGFRGALSKLFRPAHQVVLHALVNRYEHRRLRKRDFRGLWITRINAASRLHGLSYSRLINGLHRAEIDIDRKVLADIAVHDPEAFGAIAAKAKANLADS